MTHVGALMKRDMNMIDWMRVTELREEVGDEDFFEVVDLFLDEVDEIIDRLRKTPDPTRFEQDMHFLKGSALNLGFGALGRICANYENSAAAGKVQEINPSEVVTVYESSRKELTDSFESLVAA